MAKVWFVTGTSSGIGQSLVEEVLRKGDKAVALLRTPSALSELSQKYPSSQLLVVKCDVTNKKEVDNAFAEALKAFKKIDIVVNNAGYAFICEAEGSPEEDARKMFEVNFWAASYISREAIRIFRDVNGGSGGKLFNVSSTAGITADPAISYYSASKHAVEGFTESLSKELDPKWNITVTLLEFGGFRTKQYNQPAFLPAPAAYQDPSLASQQVRQFLPSPHSLPYFGEPDKLTPKIYDLAGKDKLPLRIAIGIGAVELITQKLDKAKEDINSYKTLSEGLN